MAAASGASGAAADSMEGVWAATAEGAKKVIHSPAFFRAVEATVPVAFEDGTLVVGLATTDSQHFAVLNTGEYQAVIERVLREVRRNPALRFRVIEGTSYTDWQHAKQRDEATRTSQSVTAQRNAAERATFGTWDDIYERIARMWANAEGRNIASGRGRFLEQALVLTEEAMDRLYPAEGKADDLAERGLSRVIERVASFTQSDPTVVAYLLFQRRAAKAQK